MESFNIIKKFKGIRIHYVSKELLIANKGYRIIYSLDEGLNWSKWFKISDFPYSFLANFKLLSRFFRAEVHSILKLKSGNLLIVAKKAIFRYDVNSNKLIKVLKPIGSRPLNICQDQHKNLYFGDYFSNPHRLPVNIYRSSDDGKTWNVCYTFTKIRHIHGIHFDNFENKLWVCTGDLDSECIIGYSVDGFKSFVPLFKGNQKNRAVKLLFHNNFIFYGTDSEMASNYIYRIDRKTLERKTVCQLKGSVINATKTSSGYLIATTVEPSKVNKDKFAYLLFSKDGENWKEIIKAKKDSWPAIFQFGSFRLPLYECKTNKLYFYGRALKKFDSCSFVVKN